MTKRRSTNIDIGPLSRNGGGRHHVHQRLTLDTPSRVTNASSRDPLVPSKWAVRAGGEDFLRFKSYGVGA